MESISQKNKRQSPGVIRGICKSRLSCVIFFTLQRSRWNALDLILHKARVYVFPFQYFHVKEFQPCRAAAGIKVFRHVLCTVRTRAEEHTRNRCSMHTNIEPPASRGRVHSSAGKNVFVRPEGGAALRVHLVFIISRASIFDFVASLSNGWNLARVNNVQTNVK